MYNNLIDIDRRRKLISAKYHQISLKESFSSCQDILIDNTPSFFQLLEDYFDISEFIPSAFYNAFYQSLERKRLYPLTGFLSALILQKIFSIPTDSLLIFFLSIYRELRDFCGFSKVSDAPLFTRFKQTFLPYIELMFQRMVDFTEPICQAIDSSLAQMLTFDTSGIELYVTENNPKTFNSLIRRLKSHYKNNPDVDPYKMAYGIMPSKATSCPNVKQQYLNGHFCYADKFAKLTNGLGIVRYIAFLDDDFKSAHPKMPVEKKSDYADEDKSVGDSSCLKLILADFFKQHPGFHPDTLLSDFAFDTTNTYGFLRDEFHFSRALIPYNPTNGSSLGKVGYNIYGYPTCPKDSSLDMKYAGHCHEKAVQTGISGYAPKSTWWMGNGYATVKNHATLPKRDVPLILMKTWISVFFLVSSGIRKNRFLPIKYGLL